MFAVGDKVFSIYNPWFEYRVDEVYGEECSLTITGLRKDPQEPWPEGDYPASNLFGAHYQNIELEQLRSVEVV